MSDLFAELHNATSGWRLARLEILNWGTFDGVVWKLEPNGLTSLLTGDNGSGKSTVVDALLTLLVPTSKRSYNLASGGEKKKERDETSYVLGAFGQERDEATNRSKVKTHRERATARSVLLAVLENDALKASVSLSQVFWYQGETLHKLFLVAEKGLSIATHFQGASSPTDLRKALKAQGQVCESFRDYQARFTRLFGLRSEKALALFNQTVSLKSIGSLTGFVREHMLDPGNALEELDKLRASHEDLSRSHEAILTARRQQEILDPLERRSQEMLVAGSALQEDVGIEAALPAWIAGQRQELLSEANFQEESLLSDLRQRLASREREAEALRVSLASVERAIEQDSTGVRLRELEEERLRLQGRLNDVIVRRQRLNEVLTGLSKDFPESDQARRALLEDAVHSLADLDAGRAERSQERDGLVRDLSHCDEELTALRTELDSLRQRETQIPESQIRMRRELATAVGVEDSELPFAGELLRVSQGQDAWEPAIERLLHGFALRLLVPERIYRAVRDHVDATHLRGRLVFHRTEKPRTESEVNLTDSVAGKLDIRPGTPHRAWLRKFLADRYDHLCVESLDEAPPGRHALTRSGLVRGGDSLHEKDDRHRLDDRSRWVLGWTNEEKIRALAERMAHANDRRNELAGRREKIDLELVRIRREEALWERLPDLAVSWEDLDAATLETEIARLEDEAHRLAQASDALAQLQARRREVQAEYESANGSVKELLREEGGIETRLERLGQELSICRRILSDRGVPPPAAVERLEAERTRRRAVPDLEGLPELERKLAEWIGKRKQERSLEISRHREAIQKAMGDYLRRFPADSADLSADMECLEAFLALYERVVRDDLPRHEARFRELLRDSVTREVNMFRVGLEREEREIRATLAILNASLARIPYTSSTHLQLLAANVSDEEIRSFKAQLRDCIGDVARDDEAENEARFLRIQALLKRLQDEERWRRKVIDVRNWLEFSASELYTESGAEARHYPDSAGLSGGQKAKLAYTVLASGLAWHFGLEEGALASRSLRFVVIDEAFSRSDDDSSRFCLELFRNLDLQLLVVTPSDKIHVVEPYIATCHYVWYDRDTDRSQVCDLSLAQLHERREQARRALRGES